MGPGGSKTNAELLRKVLAFYDELAHSNKANPKLQGEAAWGYFKIAAINERLGQDLEAEQAYAKAVAMFADLVAKYPDAPRYSARLAEVAVQVDPWSATDPTLKRMERRLSRIEQTLEELVRATPDRSCYQFAQARGRMKLAAARQLLQLPEAENGYREALVILDSVIDQSPDCNRARVDRADSAVALASFLIENDRQDEALTILEGAAADLQALSDKERSTLPTADRFETLGEAFELAGSPERAEQMTRLAKEILARPRKLGPPPREFGSSRPGEAPVSECDPR